MTSGTRLLALGDMAAPAAESNCQTSTLGMIQIASVFPPGHVNGFRSKMNESSKRSGLRMALPALSCAWPPRASSKLEADSTPAAPARPELRPRNSRRFGFFDFIAPFSLLGLGGVCSLRHNEQPRSGVRVLARAPARG